MQTTKRASEEREALQAREAALKFLQGQGQRIERTKGQRKPTSAEAAIIARAKAQSAPRADNTLRLLQAAGFEAGTSDLVVAQGLPWPTSEGRHWGKSFDDIFPATSQKASPTPAHHGVYHRLE